MKVHEYQAAGILKKYGISVPKAYLVEEATQAEQSIRIIQEESSKKSVVVKAQIHAGGRGKGGGVKLCNTPEAGIQSIQEILGMNLVTPQTPPEGKKVNKVLVTEAIDIAQEFYLAIMPNRSTQKHLIIASAEGGMDIEVLASTSPEKIIKEEIDPVFGIQPFETLQLACRLGITQKEPQRHFRELIKNLYRAFCQTDALLTEINPLVRTSSDHFVALDAKFLFDDNALYRQPEIISMRDFDEEDPEEVEAAKHRLNYIKLKGNVGCMVNGAGLAMATMDIIKLKGGEPANFLDVGGSASAETVKHGFRIILSDPSVSAILINIFGGIVRCDRVAKGIIAALKELQLTVPVVVRLEGTNAQEAKKLLEASDVSIISATSLDGAAELVVKEATKA